MYSSNVVLYVYIIFDKLLILIILCERFLSNEVTNIVDLTTSNFSISELFDDLVHLIYSISLALMHDKKFGYSRFIHCIIT